VQVFAWAVGFGPVARGVECEPMHETQRTGVLRDSFLRFTLYILLPISVKAQPSAVSHRSESNLQNERGMGG
jgi:hypothetical protein